mmetsp:Transcript_14749/g.37866  ORF Transcript_14749/g.37866 Transcript_14749/m.37866 type:complete len:223 (+) Transcript_14749:176-844(+)
MWRGGITGPHQQTSWEGLAVGAGDLPDDKGERHLNGASRSNVDLGVGNHLTKRQRRHGRRPPACVEKLAKQEDGEGEGSGPSVDSYGGNHSRVEGCRRGIQRQIAHRVRRVREPVAKRKDRCAHICGQTRRRIPPVAIRPPVGPAGHTVVLNIAVLVCIDRHSERQQPGWSFFAEKNLGDTRAVLPEVRQPHPGDGCRCKPRLDDGPTRHNNHSDRCSRGLE